MSLGARVSKSRKVVLVAPDGDGGVTADPAIDLKSSDVDEYFASLYEPEHLTMVDGERPTYWTIKSLTKGQKDAGSDIGNRRLLAEWYIRCGLLAHSTWTIEDDDGAVVPGAQPDRKKRGSLGESASADWYENMNFPASIADALFTMIVALNEAQRPLSKPSAPRAGPESPSKENDETGLHATP
jgi:hypothetical protein